MTKNSISIGMAFSGLIGALLFVPGVAAQTSVSSPVIAAGKAVVLDRKKGNCVSCHVIEDEPLPGNAGPPLFMMKQRYPDKAKLRVQIWDPTAVNPRTIMPPFGRHGILTEQEIDQVTEYIHSL